MMQNWVSNGFLFDVEVLFNIKKNGGRIIEVPIEAEIKEKMSWRTVWKTFLESLVLRSLLLSRAVR